MPDLVTHLCAAQIARRGALDRHFPLFALGVILPDVVSRPVHILFPHSYSFVQPLHSPVVCALYCAIVALLFVPSLRRTAFACLLAGVALHLALDSLQKQIGPMYLWLFPFSWRSGSIGLFWPEQALFFLPVTLAVTAILRGHSWQHAAPAGKGK